MRLLTGISVNDILAALCKIYHSVSKSHLKKI